MNNSVMYRIGVLFFMWMAFTEIQNTAASEADSSNYYRTELKDLLRDRRVKFDAYSQSLEQHSGIFGNKTKKDIRESNTVLINIVRTDNHIIQVLNRVLDYRTYEKVNMNYDLNQNKRQANMLMQATDTLSKQVSALTKSNVDLAKRNRNLSAWLYITLFFLFVLLLMLGKQFLSSKGKS
ncbi:MAG: hypothetical protein IPP32_10630 [Bacteroidetes bacterium]|nr:hypothetical protein [Bacteroidota bacterium]